MTYSLDTRQREALIGFCRRSLNILAGKTCDTVVELPIGVTYSYVDQQQIKTFYFFYMLLDRVSGWVCAYVPVSSLSSRKEYVKPTKIDADCVPFEKFPDEQVVFTSYRIKQLLKSGSIAPATVASQED